MLTAIDLYRAVHTELDKYESPTMSVGDFNYFFNSAIEEYLSNNYSLFDIRQKELDDIQVLIKRVNLTLDDPATSADLPSDYRTFLELSLGLVDANPRCNTPQGFTDTAKKLEADKLGYIRNNAYLKPNRYNSYYTIRANKIQLLVGDNITVSSAILEYIRKPVAVYLDPNRETPTDVGSEFPDYVDRELIKLCRRIFLENIESPRYQTQVLEQQQRTE